MKIALVSLAALILVAVVLLGSTYLFPEQPAERPAERTEVGIYGLGYNLGAVKGDGRWSCEKTYSEMMSQMQTSRGRYFLDRGYRDARQGLAQRFTEDDAKRLDRK